MGKKDTEKKTFGTNTISSLAHVLHETRTKGIKCFTIVNNTCLRCNSCYLIMIKAGALVFCENCYKELFDNIDLIPEGENEHKDLYRKWHSIYELDGDTIEERLENHPQANAIIGIEVSLQIWKDFVSECPTNPLSRQEEVDGKKAIIGKSIIEAAKYLSVEEPQYLADDFLLILEYINNTQTHEH